MEEMGDETDLGLKCLIEVRDALTETLEGLQPMLAAKYPIGDVAVRHNVAKALIFNAVDIYTELSDLDTDDIADLCRHVEYMIWGAAASCGPGLEPDEPSDLEEKNNG